ncbi:MAG: prepilin-type N-terminal cleavage/methylation domain-containing protein [Verrucomicrobia bacterium]|nr:prepilin-type N-terminal cleavage/methylation domain-containing protein [Verrucomicrobiota bacterium]
MRRGRPIQGGAPRGFTLLELLIGIVVGSIVLIVIQTSYFGALRLHQTTHLRIEEDRRVQRAVGILRRDLAGLMLPGGETSLAQGLQTSPFSGSMTDAIGERVTPNLSTNTGRIDGWTPFADQQRVAYFLVPSAAGGSGRDLIRAVTRNLLPVQEVFPEEELVLSGVESAGLSYFDGLGWTDAWDSTATDTLPGALRFSLVLAGDPAGGPAGTYEVVVPLLVKTTATVAAEEEGALP